jgi:Kef-type K+ transport system membrane component KefB
VGADALDLVSELLPLAAQATPQDPGSLVWVLGAGAAAAILSRIHHHLVLPTVVLEIVLGILIGPEGFDRAHVTDNVEFLSNLGLVMLFFFAGLEVVEHRVPRRSIVNGTVGWAISLGLGLVVGYLLAAGGLDAEWWLVGIALTTTALGTLVPVLADAGLLPTLFGRAVLGVGVAGEFWPIVVISVFLTGVYGAFEEIALLLVFAAIVAGAAAMALRARPPGVLRALQHTMHTTGQAAVRLSVFALGFLVFLAIRAGFDFVLGAFAGGLVVALAIGSEEGRPVRMRLEGIGFGFLIPIYFVVTGMTFDVDSLLSATGLALAALFLALFVVVRGTPALLRLRELGPRNTLGLVLCSGTALPLVVAIVGIGMDRGAISAQVGASMIGAGMISVLVLPLLTTTLVGKESSREGDVPARAPA